MRLLVLAILTAGICLAEIEIPQNLNGLDDVPLIKEQCLKRGKSDSYDRLKVAINETRACLEGKIDPGQIKDELEEAKKTGSMDEVFGKYCGKRQEYKDCLLKTVNVTKECLEDTEVGALDTAIRVIEEVAEFACFRDGDRLAMFVAEGGTECLSSRTDQIKDCLNSTLKLDPSGLNLASLPIALPSLRIDKEKCDKLATIQRCVVADLETNCKDTTPANIVDALFKFVKKSTCKNLKQKRNVRKATGNVHFHAEKLFNLATIKGRIVEECGRNGGEAIDFDSMQHCLDKGRLFVAPKQKYIHEMRNCTKHFVGKIEKCLSQEHKFYPSFIVEAVEAIIEFLYEHLNLNKMTAENDLIYCFQRIKSIGGIGQEITVCGQNFTSHLSETVYLPTKSVVCQLLSRLGDCLSDLTRKICVLDVALDTFLRHLSKAIEKPCLT